MIRRTTPTTDIDPVSRTTNITTGIVPTNIDAATSIIAHTTKNDPTDNRTDINTTTGIIASALPTNITPSTGIIASSSTNMFPQGILLRHRRPISLLVSHRIIVVTFIVG